MGRIIGGVVAGLAAGIAAMTLVAYLGGLAFPIPSEADARDPEQLASAFGAAPAGAKAMLLLAWFVLGLVAAAVAKRIGRRGGAGWAAASLTALLVLGNVFLLPMPSWMQAVAVAAPLIGGLLGVHLIGRSGPDAAGDA